MDGTFWFCSFECIFMVFSIQRFSGLLFAGYCVKLVPPWSSWSSGLSAQPSIMGYYSYSSLFSTCFLWFMIFPWTDYFIFLFGFVFVAFCLILYCRFLEVMRALRRCQPSWDARILLFVYPSCTLSCLINFNINNSETRILFRRTLLNFPLTVHFIYLFQETIFLIC